MRDDLNRRAVEIAPAFLLDNFRVNRPGCEVVPMSHRLVDESFVMAQVKVSFRAVVGYKNFAVLKRVHGSGIDVNIRIHFQHLDAQTPALKQKPNTG